jgi:hypothetical protein
MEVINLFPSEESVEPDVLVWMAYTCIQELLAQIFTGLQDTWSTYFPSLFGRITGYLKICYDTFRNSYLLTIHHHDPFHLHHNVCTCKSVVK